jgi:dihydrofolate reductase
MAAHWPSASGPFAKPMNEIPKVVFSDSLASAGWGETTIAAGDLAEAITRLKQERSGGYLLAHGGARFARSLVETGLIDEYRLLIHPAVLGAGERIFLALSHCRRRDGRRRGVRREPDRAGPSWGRLRCPRSAWP